MGRSLTYAEADERSRRFGAWLQNEAGLARGDRVAIMMPNLLQYPIAIIGRSRARAASSSTSIRSTRRASSSTSSRTRARRAIVIFENFGGDARAGDHAHEGRANVIVTGIGDLLGFPKSRDRELRDPARSRRWCRRTRCRARCASTTCSRQGASLTLDPVEVSGDDVAFLQYTGGTTGVSKGAVLTHRNMVANTLQVVAVMAGAAEFTNRRRHHGAAALSHLLADGELLVFMHVGAQQRADHQSARHSGLRQGAFEAQVHLHHRRQHAVQRAAQHAGLRQARLQLADRSRSAAAWPCSARSRNAGSGSPAGTSARAGASPRPRPSALHQPAAHERLQRLDRLPIPSTDISIRDDDGHALPAGAGRRDLRTRPAGDARLLEPARTRPRR